MSQSTPDRTVYRWSRARLVRPLGRLLVGLGGLWLLVVLVMAVSGSQATAPYGVLGVISLLAILVGLVALARPPAVLEVTSSGYRLRNLRGGGTPSGRWADVRRVTVAETVAGPALVVQGRGEERSVVPLDLLGGQATEVQRRVNGLLNSAHGYRQL